MRDFLKLHLTNCNKQTKTYTHRPLCYGHLYTITWSFINLQLSSFSEVVHTIALDSVFAWQEWNSMGSSAVLAKLHHGSTSCAFFSAHHGCKKWSFELLYLKPVWPLSSTKHSHPVNWLTHWMFFIFLTVPHKNPRSANSEILKPAQQVNEIPFFPISLMFFHYSAHSSMSEQM